MGGWGARTRHEEQAHLRGDDVPSCYGGGEQERVPAKDADDPGLVAPGFALAPWLFTPRALEAQEQYSNSK